MAHFLRRAVVEEGAVAVSSHWRSCNSAARAVSRRATNPVAVLSMTPGRAAMMREWWSCTWRIAVVVAAGIEQLVDLAVGACW